MALLVPKVESRRHSASFRRKQDGLCARIGGFPVSRIPAQADIGGQPHRWPASTLAGIIVSLSFAFFVTLGLFCLLQAYDHDGLFRSRILQ